MRLPPLILTFGLKSEVMKMAIIAVTAIAVESTTPATMPKSCFWRGKVVGFDVGCPVGSEEGWLDGCPVG